MLRKLCALLVLITVICSCQGKDQADSATPSSKKMRVTSPAFREGGDIPSRYTCDGAGMSPPLAWASVPDKTKSLALICEDPDAPAGVFVHWVLFNLPAHPRSLPENVPPKLTLANGAKHGTNDFGRLGYGAPCPPSGTHRYYFKMYALDKKLDLPAGTRKPKLLAAMNGHILAKGKLMGKYSRQ